MTTPLMAELLPCPMCGCEAEHLHIYDGEEIVRCFGYQVNDAAHACRNSVFAETEAEAYAAWNRRVPRWTEAQAREKFSEWWANNDGTYVDCYLAALRTAGILGDKT